MAAADSEDDGNERRRRRRADRDDVEVPRALIEDPGGQTPCTRRIPAARAAVASVHRASGAAPAGRGRARVAPRSHRRAGARSLRGCIRTAGPCAGWDPMKVVLDHVGIAVKDLSAALAFYRDALGLEVEPPEDVALQRVRAHVVPVGESSIELLEATAADSPIARFLDTRGPGLHHITLRVEDIAAALAHLKARSVKLIDQQPRPGAERALVAFVRPSSAHGVLVELKQASPGGQRSLVAQAPGP